jgi:hypothetical protein
VSANENINGEGARRVVFYPGHSDAAGVRKIEQFCGAVRNVLRVRRSAEELQLTSMGIHRWAQAQLQCESRAKNNGDKANGVTAPPNEQNLEEWLIF